MAQRRQLSSVEGIVFVIKPNARQERESIFADVGEQRLNDVARNQGKGGRRIRKPIQRALYFDVASTKILRASLERLY